jgi:hypothetical protein
LKVSAQKMLHPFTGLLFALASHCCLVPQAGAQSQIHFLQTPFVAATSSTDRTATVASLSLDMNKDGYPDLVTVQQDGAVNVLLNPATGNAYDMKVTSSTANPGVNYVFASGRDLNADGYPDIVVTDTVNNAAYVYINKGDGSLKAPVEYPINFASGATFGGAGGGLVLADTNGDGIPDLLAVGYVPPVFNPFGGGSSATTITVRTMLGKGDGTFAAALPEHVDTVQNVSIQGKIGQLMTADMNNDGKVDLLLPVVGSTTQSFGPVMFTAVLLGNGAGGFSAFPAVPSQPTGFVPVDESSSAFYAGDVTGDGNADVLFGLGQNTIWLQKGNGDGTLQPPVAVVTTDGTYYGGATVLTFADVNGDGHVDIVAHNQGYIAVYLGVAGGTFSQIPLVQLASGTPGTVEAQPADFNHDGSLDLVQVDSITGRGGFYLQQNGTFAGTTAVTDPGETAQAFNTVATGDLNGDGFPDLIAEDAAREDGTGYGLDLVMGINDGKGAFTYLTILNYYSLANVVAVEPLLKDLNGDSRPDVLTSNIVLGRTASAPISTSMLAYSANNGDGTFAPLTNIPLTVGGVDPQCPVGQVDIGDVNGDGIPDIVAAYQGDALCYSTLFIESLQLPGTLTAGTIPSGVYILLGHGNGTYQANFLAYGQAANVLKLTDLNGDGKLDLVVSDGTVFGPYNPFTGVSSLIANPYGTYLLPGNGDGTFNTANEQTLLPLTEVASIMPGDFNGDGKQDLVLGVVGQVDGNGNFLPGTTGNYALQGNGDFTFQPPTILTPGTFALDGKLVDLNGDGLPDLALNQATLNDFTANTDGNLVVLTNQGGGAFSVASGSFTTPVELTDPTLAYEESGNLFVGDFNGDGAPDVLNAAHLFALTDASTSTIGLNQGPTLAGFNLRDGLTYQGLSELYLNSGSAGLSVAASAANATRGTSVTLTATLAPALNLVAPTGSVSFSANGTSLGSANVSNGSAVLSTTELPLGSDTVQASYTGDSNYNPAKASVGIQILPVPAPSIPVTLSVTASAATVVQDSSVTLTADLTFANTALSPSGTIVFYANGTTLASLPVSANGASLTLSTLPSGTDQITASYSGDADFKPATTANATVVTVTTLAPAFTLSSPATLTIVRGQTGFASISAQANATFSGAVSFTCSGAPVESTCTVTPASLTLAAGQASSISVSIATTEPNNTGIAEMPHGPGLSGIYAGGALTCVLLPIAFLPGSRRRFKGKVLATMLVAMALAGSLAMTGCGGGVKYPGTPPGTSTLTITGTSGSTVATTSITVIVSQ